MISKTSFRNHKDRIFAQAVQEFEKLVRSKKEIPLKIFQRFRSGEEQRLKRWHASGGSGYEIAERRSDLVDVLFKELFDLVVEQVIGEKKIKGLCVGAFGGYGRGEMNPYSDVDIMFLHEKESPTPAMEKIISAILMTLWDLGFKVGHATRSLAGAIKHANEEMLSKTAMLECRLLAGDKETFKSFKEKFKKKCILGHEQNYIAWRLENLQKLREKFGKTVFMQEPNIKSGKGGLRDYQNLLWVSIFYHGAASLSRLVELKILRESERKKLEKAYDFLLRVRNEMHYQERRPSDQLTLLLQGKVATALGYQQRHIIRRSEAFMKDYYEKTRDISLITTAILDRMKVTEKSPRFFRGLTLGIFNSRKKSEHLDGFIFKQGMVFPENREIFNKEPERMMKAFHLAQVRSLEFSPQLSDLIKQRLLLVDRTFQYSKEIHGIFLSILSRKGEVGRILRLMHDLGFLGKYLPEFGVLTCLVQHEFYHRYTADEHTLVCIEKIDALLFTHEKKLLQYSSIFKNIDDPAILYLGMLLHDTGKAANVRYHAEASALAAQKVARRFQISGERLHLFITLVDAHGELGTVARTRNLDDFSTISDFANIVRTQPTLDALMILTLADGMGTGDGNWSDWKEQLVWNLYHQTKKYLEVGPIFFEKNRQDRAVVEQAVKERLPENFSQEIREHFEQMPDRYVRMMEVSRIAEHLQFFRLFFERLNPTVTTEKSKFLQCAINKDLSLKNLGEKKRANVFKNHLENKSLQKSITSNCKSLVKDTSFLDSQICWREYPELGHTEVWICGWDRKNLLMRIAAAFLVADINILSADIFTRQDNLTLDIFRVTSGRSDPLLSEKEKKTMEKYLKELLAQPFNSSEKTEMRFLVESSSKGKNPTKREADNLKGYLLTKPGEPSDDQQKISPSVKLEGSEADSVRVSINNESHPLYTLVDVEAPDRPGLFYDFLEALNYQGISIDLARITTEMKAALDTFYILGADGKKITESQLINELQSRLLAAASLIVV